MKLGDNEYKAALQRWAVLYDTRFRTFEQEAELEALHKRLDAAERAGVIAKVVNDYDDLRHIGDLSGAEL